MISFDLLCDISEYSKKHLESSCKKYSSRKQNPQFQYKNIMDGKIAEFCAYFYLQKKGLHTTVPDLEIYNSNNKSYDSDIYVPEKDIHIHVKSISKHTSENFGDSFLIEKNDPIVLRPGDNHYFLIMKEVDFLKYQFFTWLKSTDAKYGKPKLNLPTKLAVYLQ